MTRRKALVVSVWFAVALLPLTAHAEEPNAPAEGTDETGTPITLKSGPYWVDFEAGHVEIDPDLNRLELEKKVAIKAWRYRLTSEKLVLRRTPRGIVVDGEGRVAFCPCPDPLVTFGFKQAIVAPPTDLFVEQPTVRLGGVPVFWLPLLWLRAPDRLGLLPPRIAWRGDDGLIAGAGVHVPLGGKRGPTLETIDVFASGYLKGGAEVTTQLATEHTTSLVRWDHLEESLLAVDTHGASTSKGGATAAWRLDALRGERGRRGTIDLEPAARRYDRGRLFLGGASGGFVAGIGALSVADRGGALDDFGWNGPTAHAGIGLPLGGGSEFDTELDAFTLARRGEASSSRAVHHGSLGAATRAGPLLASARIDELGLAESTEEATSVVGTAGLRARVSLPLARVFGTSSDAVIHWVEPFVEAGARTAARDESATAPLDQGALPSDDRVFLGAGGIRSSLGSFAGRASAAFDGRAGFVGTSEDPEPVAAATLRADSQWIGANARSAIEIERQRSVAVAGKARFGRVDSLHLRLGTESRFDDEPVPARALFYDTWDFPDGAWFDRRGFTGSAEVGIPWTEWLATLAGADVDLEHERWLSERGSIAYRHRCGCLALIGSAARRIGRPGFDAQITLDLMP